MIVTVSRSLSTYIHVSCKCTDMGLLEFIDADYTYSFQNLLITDHHSDIIDLMYICYVMLDCEFTSIPLHGQLKMLGCGTYIHLYWI